MARKPKKLTHDHLVSEYDRSGEGQYRSEQIYVYEGSVSEGGDDVVFHREELEMMDKNGLPHKISWNGVKSCSFGHIVSADQNRIIGKCLCGNYLCAARGCAFSCRHCGKVCCRKCIVIFDKNSEHVEFYCKKHAYLYYVRHILRFLF